MRGIDTPGIQQTLPSTDGSENDTLLTAEGVEVVVDEDVLTTIAEKHEDAKRTLSSRCVRSSDLVLPFSLVR